MARDKQQNLPSRERYPLKCVREADLKMATAKMTDVEVGAMKNLARFLTCRIESCNLERFFSTATGLSVLRIILLALAAMFLVSVQLSVWLTDGILTSAVVVLTVTIVSSLASWLAFSWASKRFRLSGVLLCVIIGASLALPFLSVLGPLAGIIVGTAAGFSASRLQRRMEDPSKSRPLRLAAITLAAAYLGLTAIALGTYSPPMWDGGSGPWFGYESMLGEPEPRTLMFYTAETVQLLASAASLTAAVLPIQIWK